MLALPLSKSLSEAPLSLFCFVLSKKGFNTGNQELRKSLERVVGALRESPGMIPRTRPLFLPTGGAATPIIIRKVTISGHCWYCRVQRHATL